MPRLAAAVSDLLLAFFIFLSILLPHLLIVLFFWFCVIFVADVCIGYLEGANVISIEFKAVETGCDHFEVIAIVREPWCRRGYHVHGCILEMCVLLNIFHGKVGVVLDWLVLLVQVGIYCIVEEVAHIDHVTEVVS